MSLFCLNYVVYMLFSEILITARALIKFTPTTLMSKRGTYKNIFIQRGAFIREGRLLERGAYKNTYLGQCKTTSSLKK